MVRRNPSPSERVTWIAAALQIIPTISAGGSETDLVEACEVAAEKIAKMRDPLFSYYKTEDSRRSAGTKVRALYDANSIVGFSALLKAVEEFLPFGEGVLKREKPVTAVAHEIRRIGRMPPADVIRAKVLGALR